MSNLLILTVFLPLAGIPLVWAASYAGRHAVRLAALGVTSATLALACWLIAHFQDDPAGFAITNLSWLADTGPGIDVRFSFGLDGVSLWLFGLSALLSVTAVLVSWEPIVDRVHDFYIMLLLLETGMLGVFTAQDLILFYVFFEFTLIPLFFLIGVWGHEERRYAAVKFFLFTFAGSVLTFLGLLAIVLWVNYHGGGRLTFDIPELTAALQRHPIPMDAEHGYLQLWIFLALFAGFAIKFPLLPLHTWLPLAHVQAPTGGSVDLAGILLKIGAYGFIRFSLPMLPEASAAAMPWVLWLSLAGILYGAMVALAQSDLKKLIAYSSVSHMGFVMLGLFALNRLGMQGGVLQMINHGLSSAGLFAVVGMTYERYHTREMSKLGGIARQMPVLTFFVLLFTLASIGLPGLNGFVGEFLILLGMFQRAFEAGNSPLVDFQFKVIAVLAVLGVVLGAWYMLLMVQRVYFGPVKHAGHGHGDAHVRDLSPHEILALAPLAVFIVWIGLFPQFFLERMAPSLDRVATSVNQQFDARFAGSIEPAMGGMGKRSLPVASHPQSSTTGKLRLPMPPDVQRSLTMPSAVEGEPNVPGGLAHDD